MDSTRNRLSGQFQFMDQHPKSIVWTIPINWQSPKAFVQAIPIHRQHSKPIVNTIPINRWSPKSVVWTIPINRQSPKSIIWTIPISRQSPKSIVWTTPINRQNRRNQLPGQSQLIDNLLNQLQTHYVVYWNRNCPGCIYMRWCLSVCESDFSGLKTYDVYHVPIHTEIAINSAEEQNAAMVLWEQQCVSVGAVLQIRSVRSEGCCWQVRLFLVVQLLIPKMVYRRWATTAVYILLWTWCYFTMGPLSRKKRNQNDLPAMTVWNELQISSFETQRGKPTKWRRNQTPREKSQGQENGKFMLRRHGGVAVPLFSLSRTIVGRNYEQLSTKQKWYTTIITLLLDEDKTKLDASAAVCITGIIGATDSIRPSASI